MLAIFRFSNIGSWDWSVFMRYFQMRLMGLQQKRKTSLQCQLHKKLEPGQEWGGAYIPNLIAISLMLKSAQHPKIDFLFTEIKILTYFWIDSYMASTFKSADILELKVMSNSIIWNRAVLFLFWPRVESYCLSHIFSEEGK